MGLSLLFFIASSAYQIYQSNKAKRKMEDAIDKTKGIEFTVRGEAVSLPKLYGGVKTAGIRTFYKVNNNYNFAEPNGISLDREPATGQYYDDDNRVVEATVTTTTANDKATKTYIRQTWEWKGEQVKEVNGRSVTSISQSPSLPSGDSAKSYITSNDGYTYVRGTLQSTGIGGRRYGISRYKSLAASGILSHGLETSQAGNKGEYLLIQHAIAHEGLQNFRDVTVNDLSYDYKDFRYGQRILLRKEGGVADSMAVANGAAATNTFTGVANSSMVFKLNRDDYNYNGEPEVRYFIHGSTVRDIEEVSSGVYEFSTTRIFSRNPALILADYLTDSTAGLGVSDDLIDLETFYKSKVICDTTVLAEKLVPGRINRSVTYTQQGIGDVFPAKMGWYAGSKVTTTWPPGEEDITVRFYTTSTITNMLTEAAKLPIVKSLLTGMKGKKVRIYLKARGTADAPLRLVYNAGSAGVSSELEGDFSLKPFYQELSYTVTVPNDDSADHGLMIASTAGSYFDIIEMGIDDGIRDIKLYECNLALNTGKTIRENISEIISPIGNAEAFWSEGKYKLVVPDLLAATPALRQTKLESSVVMSFTQEDIIEDRVEIQYPNAQDRYNQFTVRFSNELEDFKEDAMTWPDTLDSDGNETLSVYTQYLAEDNGKPLKGESQIPGITTPWHALAKAEELVRQSRSGFVVNLTLNRKALVLEPGDFVSVDYPSMGLNQTILRVKQVELLEDLTASVELYYLDPESMAWNVPDNIAYTTSVYTSFSITPPSNVVFDPSPTLSRTFANSPGKLTWDTETNSSAYEYEVSIYSYDAETTTVLGTTKSNEFVVPPLSIGDYSFVVRSKSPLGKLSPSVLALTDLADDNTFRIGITTPIYDTLIPVYRNSNTLVITLTQEDDSDEVGYVNTNGVEDPTTEQLSTVVFHPLAGYSVSVTVLSGSLNFRNNVGSAQMRVDLYYGGKEVTDYTGWTFGWYDGVTQIAGVGFTSPTGVTNNTPTTARTITVTAAYIPDNGSKTFNITATRS